jgi:streptomycin 6-kinase
MSKFENNIISIYREGGKEWLKRLPEQVRQLELLWGLNDLKPLENLTYNYVLSGLQGDVPVILKLSLNASDLDREANALAALEGFGCVSVLDKQDHALLLQRALPGQPLKGYPLKKGIKSIEIVCKVVEGLHRAPLLKDGNFPHIEDWLGTLDKDWGLPGDYLQKARTIKKELLRKSTELPVVLLHGDLHQDNILAHGDDWLVIDPKGVIGFPINEGWACVEEPHDDLEYIAKYFSYKFDDVVEWYYVQAILAACWQMEDNLDPTRFLNLAASVMPLMKYTK